MKWREPSRVRKVNSTLFNSDELSQFLQQRRMKLVSTFIRNNLHCTRKRRFYLPCLTYTTFTHQQKTDTHEYSETADFEVSVSSNPCLSLLRFCKTVASLRRVHTLLIVHGLTGNILCTTKLVSLYGSFGFIVSARSVFDRMPNPDFYSWKVMLRWYFLNGLFSEIIPFYNRMRIFIEGYDDIVVSVVLKACCELRDIVEGRKVHCQVIKSKSTDSFVMTSLVDMYAKSGDVESAYNVFNEIDDRNVVSWTSMIVAYVQNDCPEQGLTLFNRMREGLVAGNEFTIGSLITACTKLGYLHHGKWFHGFIIKNGVELNSSLITSLLDMYAKCGDIRDARLVFDELLTVDLVSWTAMMVGYTKRGHPNRALELFTDEKWEGLLPNSVTISSLLSACAQLNDLNMGQLLHCLGLKLGLYNDFSVINALMDMYAKCGLIEDARHLFEMNFDRDVVSWNSIISGYAQAGSGYEALRLFQQMRLSEYSPDAVTLVSVLTACISLSAIHIGSSLHAFSVKIGLISSSIYVATALLNFYSKCGNAKSARLIFDGMTEKNLVTWSAMIGGYGIQGDCDGSIALFSDMLKEELQPNYVVFTAILTACSHTGMVGEGWRLFNIMCQEFNFVPSLKHYACMVDLLSRAGRLDEALHFIDTMPVQPNVSVFGAFLHGCGLHSRFDLGEVAIRKMLELHPDDACYYVLMSNLCASDGRWSRVKQLRELMKERRLNKVPGCSMMETDKMDCNPYIRNRPDMLICTEQMH